MEQDQLPRVIAEEMQEVGLSYRQMADFLRVPHMTLHRMINGYRGKPAVNFGVEYHERLCKHYGLIYTPPKT